MSRKPKGKGVWINFHRDDDGIWHGVITINFTDGGTGMRMSGTDEGVHESERGPGTALARSLAIADSLTSNPLLLPLLPPGALPALWTAKALVRAHKSGALQKVINGKKVWDHFSSPFRALAKGLSDVKKAVMGCPGGPVRLCDGRHELAPGRGRAPSMRGVPRMPPRDPYAVALLASRRL